MSSSEPRAVSTVCVYCGSSMGSNEAYAAAATRLGEVMAERGVALVYGGGSIGLMGCVARTVDENGGSVTGVIPEALADVTASGEGLGTVIEVKTMHERKTKMAELADAFIALPGGFGTAEELFETTTWSQLGIHNKAIGVLNTNGYYDPLIQMIEKGIEEGFIAERFRGLVVFESDPEVLLDRVCTYVPPPGLDLDWSLQDM